MTRDERIRHIFLKPRRFTRARAAEALGKSIQWVEASRFSWENGGWVSWQEMVLMAYLLWTRLQIARALGDDYAKVYPARARLVRVSVLLPEYLAIALRHNARRKKSDISEIVADDISSGWCDAQSIDKTVPGYLEAWHFPYPVADAEEYRVAADRRGGCPDD
jgi:hypothetical protein